MQAKLIRGQKREKIVRESEIDCPGNSLQIGGAKLSIQICRVGLGENPRLVHISETLQHKEERLADLLGFVLVLKDPLSNLLSYGRRAQSRFGDKSGDLCSEDPGANVVDSLAYLERGAYDGYRTNRLVVGERVEASLSVHQKGFEKVAFAFWWHDKRASSEA